MQNSRLIALLETLSNKETREIRNFLASPFFNKRIEVAQLFDYLSDCLHLHQHIPEKRSAYRHLKGKQADYDDQQMRLWMSFLLKTVEKYLVHKAVFEDEVKTKTKLAEIYRLRNLPKHLDRSLRELETLQNKQSFRNATFYSNDFQIQVEQYRFTSANRRMSELNLQKMLDNLDIAYLSQKLRQSCLAISHQAVYNTQYHFGLSEEIINYVEQQDLLKIPAIAIYYYVFQTLSKPDESKYFRSFKTEVVKHGAQFPAEELGDIYILAINFCIKKYNEGDKQFLQDEFELYQEGLKQNLFLKNNILSRFTYRNVVTVGLVLEEFQWLESFISDYRNKLDKAYQESMFSFNLARLEYSRKNYKAALHLLQKSLYKDLLLNLAAKTVILKIFYELDEFDLLDAHLQAMRTFIRRKNIIGYHQENYLNLIQFTKKLIEANPYEKEGIQQIKKEIEATKSIAEKGWLLQQC